jgi:hypothetical protein
MVHWINDLRIRELTTSVGNVEEDDQKDIVTSRRGIYSSLL